MKEFRLPPGTELEVPAQILEVPFFATLSSRIVRALIRSCTVVECEPGDYLIREGTRDDSLLFLLSGELQIEKDGKQLAGAWKKGEMLGEISYLRGTPRSATLIAHGRVQCLRLGPGFLEQLSEADQHAYHAALYRFLAGVLADRLEVTSRKLVRMEEREVAEV
ncbi:MAG: cyclic nucleotide-binding domain-containing protein [Verrucomicrobiota bacterium]